MSFSFEKVRIKCILKPKKHMELQLFRMLGNKMKIKHFFSWVWKGGLVFCFFKWFSGAELRVQYFLHLLFTQYGSTKFR